MYNALANQIRMMALHLLNDDEGINEEGWDRLFALLKDSGNHDVANAVVAVNGRYYLDEEDFKLLINKKP